MKLGSASSLSWRAAPPLPEQSRGATPGNAPGRRANVAPAPMACRAPGRPSTLKAESRGCSLPASSAASPALGPRGGPPISLPSRPRCHLGPHGSALVAAAAASAGPTRGLEDSADVSSGPRDSSAPAPAARPPASPGAGCDADAEEGAARAKWVEERGLRADIQGSFYRAESTLSRDLATIAASLLKRGLLPHQAQEEAYERSSRSGRRRRDQANGAAGREASSDEGGLQGADGGLRTLRVLDVMSGSGIRGMRYLAQADADFVWCNDASVDVHPALLRNLRAIDGITAAPSAPSAIAPSSDRASAATCASSVQSAGAGSSSAELDRGILEAWAPGGLTGVGAAGGGVPCAGPWGHGNSGLDQGDDAALAGDAKWRKAREGKSGVEGRHWRITHEDALRILYLCYQRKEFFDVVDLDSFGGDTSCLGPALGATSYKGGLLYATSTDGFSSGGHAPLRALASFGAFVRGPIPFCNELGLRMLIGAAVREGAVQGLAVSPLFSLYSAHGPVFRTMLRVSTNGAAAAAAGGNAAGPDPGRRNLMENYGFIAFCRQCGESRVMPWNALGAGCWCTCSHSAQADSGALGASASSTAPVVAPQSPAAPLAPEALLPGTATPVADTLNPESQGAASTRSPFAPAGPAAEAAGSGRPMLVVGPVWTGPLHCGETVRLMAQDAAQRGWGPAERVLHVMESEADPRLPPWFIKLDDISKAAGVPTPPVTALLAALQQRGVAVSRSHVEPRAVKVSCSKRECVDVVRQLRAGT